MSAECSHECGMYMNTYVHTYVECSYKCGMYIWQLAMALLITQSRGKMRHRTGPGACLPGWSKGEPMRVSKEYCIHLPTDFCYVLNMSMTCQCLAF